MTENNGTLTEDKAVIVESKPTPRLRLLKVFVQPVFIFDDGETLTEQTADIVLVTAKDWPTYYERFAEEILVLEQQYIESVLAENNSKSE